MYYLSILGQSKNKRNAEGMFVNLSLINVDLAVRIVILSEM